MIDLEQERKAFEEQWKFLGGHLLYVEWTTDNMYSLSATANALSKSDKISLFNAINTAWGLWVVQAKQNISVIDSLKTQLMKLDEGYVKLPKELSIETATRLAESNFKSNEKLIAFEHRAMTDTEYQKFKERWIYHKAVDIKGKYGTMIEDVLGDIINDNS